MAKKVAICLYCNGVFEYFESQSTGKYCSRVCSADDRNKQLVESGTASAWSVRAYLVKHIEMKCSVCQLSNVWNGKPLTLHMDHIDGNNKNNVLSNVRWICPNCHQQTETWGSQNISDENRAKLSTNKRK